MGTTKPKRAKKYSTKVAIVAANVVQGQCSCTWVGNKLSGDTSLEIAIESAQTELATHKHLEKKK